MQLVRRAIEVTGTVQGVGFRPFVHRLAQSLDLVGCVHNVPGGVCIEVEGDQGALDRFLAELTESPPDRARIADVRCVPMQPLGERSFSISASERALPGDVVVAPDTTTCDACLEELFDPSNRRHGYALLGCATCGPRLTIVTSAPWDRERTTMAGFAMCGACRAEYDDPRDRRFHAEATACHACGPTLRALDRAGGTVAGDPLELAAAALARGEIVALKGLGGYHLACDARDERAVSELRRRKRRDAKPFALLVADVDAATSICELSAAERALLASPERPIVLARTRADTHIASAVAPGLARVGVMLPPTPLHHLLARRLDAPLVMTSGNVSDEPIAYVDADAVARLGAVADLFVAHDRAIHVRCDDSVAMIFEEAPLPLRRSRGYAPSPVPLPAPLAAPTLATGGHLKATFAIATGTHAVVSHHLGDLDDYEALRAYEASIAHYERLFRVAPRRIVHDAHPDYASTRWALLRAAREDVELVAVQHHHAHVASCMADNELARTVVGVAFDGAGFGADGAIWGGEFLVGDAAHMVRAAHLRYVPMPGGERALRQPWRMAVAHLLDAGEDPFATVLASRVGAADLGTVVRMVERRINAPMTSSAGRLFDAVASLAGLCDLASFEGHAPMLLESLALGAEDDGSYSFELDAGDPIAIDTRPLIREVLRDVRRGLDPARVAVRFHATMARLTVAVCRLLCRAHGCRDVVLTGGVFANLVLAGAVVRGLRDAGLEPHVHRRVPPNDGGLCLGQLAVLAARDQKRRV